MNVSDAAGDDSECKEAQPQTFRVPDESDFLFVFSSFQGNDLRLSSSVGQCWYNE